MRFIALLIIVAEQKNFNVVITKEKCKNIMSGNKYKGTSKADIEKRLRYVYEQLTINWEEGNCGRK